MRARWSELTSARGPLDRVVSGRGRVRGSARDGRARSARVAPLVEDLVHSATATLTAAGGHAEQALRAALVAPARAGRRAVGRRVVGDRRATVGPRPTRPRARGPRRACGSCGRRSTVAPDVDASRRARRRRKAERALGDDGLAAIALAAAAGVQGARDLLVVLIDEAGERAADELRTDLVDRVAAQVALERAAVGEVLADPDLADDAASRLRLRLAVLKGLT